MNINPQTVTLEPHQPQILTVRQSVDTGGGAGPGKGTDGHQAQLPPGHIHNEQGQLTQRPPMV